MVIYQSYIYKVKKMLLKRLYCKHIHSLLTNQTFKEMFKNAKLYFDFKGCYETIKGPFVIPAVSSGRRVVNRYVRVGPNRWSRRSDVSGV